MMRMSEGIHPATPCQPRSFSHAVIKEERLQHVHASNHGLTRPHACRFWLCPWGRVPNEANTDQGHRLVRQDNYYSPSMRSCHHESEFIRLAVPGCPGLQKNAKFIPPLHTDNLEDEVVTTALSEDAVAFAGVRDQGICIPRSGTCADTCT